MNPETDGWSPLAKVYDPLMVGSIDGTDELPHDHGIVRAMNARYKPNKSVVSDPLKTIFVARLNPKTDEATLEATFSAFGAIKQLCLVRDIVTGFSKCYAFIEYTDQHSAFRAHGKGCKLVIDDNEIFVDYECERTLLNWVPRRFGGGFGGKKESGQLRFGGRDRPFRKPIILDTIIKGHAGYRNNDFRDRQGGRSEWRRNQERERYRGGRDRSPIRYSDRSHQRDRNSNSSRDRFRHRN